MLEESAQKQFFLTPGHKCSYIQGREAHTLFLDPRDTHSPDTYARLTQIGFRRSGGHLYRPHCNQCRACIPTRIPVENFSLSRRFQRIIKKNQDLEIRIERAEFSSEYYELYVRYITGRHRDGDMYPPTPEQFRSFLLASWSETFFLSIYISGQLSAVAVTDVSSKSLSAIYTFFDPDFSHRSLGVYSVLKQIDECRQRNLDYLYLGYWIKDAKKMSYKTEYRPIELLINQRWVKMT